MDILPLFSLAYCPSCISILLILFRTEIRNQVVLPFRNCHYFFKYNILLIKHLTQQIYLSSEINNAVVGVEPGLSVLL